MRVGMTFFCQNAQDWDRYEAEERGEDVPAAPAVSDRQIFLEDVELAKEADELGFDTVWTIEHHFTPYTMVTNPLQLLTYLAGVTKNVDLGTMVVVLPWHNPVRLAEDVNMLDSLLGGRRVVLGVGRGLGRREFKGLNIDQNEARGRFDENLDVLTRLLRDGRIERYDGVYNRIEDLRLRPQPVRDLTDNLYCAAGSPETMEIIARLGVKPMIIPNTDLETSLAGMRRYADVRAESGFDPIDTRLALWTYVTPNADEARGPAEQYMASYASTALRHYEMLGDHLATTKGYEAYGARSALLRQQPDVFTRAFASGHPWGTPEMVIERVKSLADTFGTSEITFVFRYGGMPIDMARSSMQLFAKEVLPVIKTFQPAPMAGAAHAVA